MSVLKLPAAGNDFVEPCLPSRTAHPPLGPVGFTKSIRWLSSATFVWQAKLIKLVAALACPFTLKWNASLASLPTPIACLASRHALEFDKPFIRKVSSAGDLQVLKAELAECTRVALECRRTTPKQSCARECGPAWLT